MLCSAIFIAFVAREQLLRFRFRRPRVMERPLAELAIR
jgi:hypothetical protein